MWVGGAGGQHTVGGQSVGLSLIKLKTVGSILNAQHFKLYV